MARPTYPRAGEPLPAPLPPETRTAGQPVAEAIRLCARPFRRGAALGRADFVHALGSLATLVITIVLTGLVLFFLIQSFGDQALRVAAFLAFLVLTPLFFLGAALLYVDQAARAGSRRWD